MSGCKAGDNCLFPHYKVEEQPNNNNNKTTRSFQNGKSEDESAAAAVKKVLTRGLCLARLRAFRTSEKREATAKPEA